MWNSSTIFSLQSDDFLNTLRFNDRILPQSLIGLIILEVLFSVSPGHLSLVQVLKAFSIFAWRCSHGAETLIRKRNQLLLMMTYRPEGLIRRLISRRDVSLSSGLVPK